MAELRNPGAAGRFGFDTFVYAASGVDYATVPALSEYQVYDSPHPEYVTGRIDISAFGQLGFFTPWPFSPTDVPLNGHVCVPRGRGPFPLAVFAHGNHDPLENSTPGYLYLCELLASHGIIAATIDANFLNGFNFGENDARAIVHLEHLKQFRTWAGSRHHPLYRKVDLDRILIIGHSRGGEGVGHASLFNTLSSVQPDVFSPVVPLDGSAGLGPYGFSLSGVAAIAPTDRQYEPVAGPTVVLDAYYLVHGSRDGDVSSFEGYNTYNRSHAVDLVNPTMSDGKHKALLWVIGANHNQFNSMWASETPLGTAISRSDQERVTKVHLGALAQALLLRRPRYLAVLRDHAVTAPWLPPGTDLVSQYQDPRRVFLMHNQEAVGAPQISAPVQGTATAVGVLADRQLFDLVGAGPPQSTITLRVEWNAPGGRLDLDVDPATLPLSRYRTLAFRMGQSTEALNPAGQDQDVTVEISSGSRTAVMRVSSLHRLLYPDLFFGAGKMVMQSLRLPLRDLVALGVPAQDLRSISFVFDRTTSGVVYIGDVQLSD
jgi:hypothetical protein